MKKIITMLIILLANLLIIVGCSSNPENMPSKNDKDFENIKNTPINDSDISIINNTSNEISKSIDWENIPIFISEEKGDINEYIDKTDGHMDEFGNFIKTGKSYQYDITSIKITSDDNFAYFLIELADNLEHYFNLNRKNKNMGGSIGKFLIDTDNNENTGEEEIFTKNKGFNKELILYVSTNQDYFYSVGYRLDLLPFDFDKRIDKNSEDKSDYISIDQNLIEFKVSLKELDINQNKKIRIMFKEDGGIGSFADKFSDVIIKEIN
ncbi:MAG: hypothetical protein WA055_05340 [Candidatus Moraniibacteriota bacterium]